MQKFLLTLALLTPALLTGCKKEQVPDPPGNLKDDMVHVDYFHLKPGNYWIYQLFDVDTQGNATPTPVFDSVYAASDTIINGKTYQTLMEPGTGTASGYIPYYFRDSAQYKVDHLGRILFSSLDFKTVFRSFYSVPWGDTVALVRTLMTDRNITVTVPAGTYATAVYSELWNMYPAYQNAGAVRRVSKRYNASIGLIAETLPFYLTSTTTKERYLVRYSVK